MLVNIRLANAADGARLQAIYGPIVADTAQSFEMEPPTAVEMAQRVTSTLARLPWLVCEVDGVVAGYAYASPYRARLAYQWSAEVSAYVDVVYRRRRIGTALYTVLFDLLVMQGYYTALAGITLPNAPSIRLHESLGFVGVGVYHGVGFKHGAWRDVGWWECALQPKQPNPMPPQPVDAISGMDGALAAMQSGASLVVA